MGSGYKMGLDGGMVLGGGMEDKRGVAGKRFLYNTQCTFFSTLAGLGWRLCLSVV